MWLLLGAHVRHIGPYIVGMDFEFSEQQEQLRSTARSLLAQFCGSERGGEAIASPPPFYRALWKQMVDLGWLTVDLPPEAGGFGTGFVEASILLEEIGRTLAPVDR